jgi:DNA-directed RNA polymerase
LQIAIQRQKAAFPPNFVHSLDSSHMMMTAIACKEAGLHFAGLVLVDIDWSILHSTYVEQYVASHVMLHREGLELEQHSLNSENLFMPRIAFCACF